MSYVEHDMLPYQHEVVTYKALYFKYNHGSKALLKKNRNAEKETACFILIILV